MPQTVPSADGTDIAFWSTGSGPPLLLVHGAMSDHRRWRIVPLLAAHRTVHAMDRRGRGGSGDGSTWSLEREVEDVVAVVETLAAQAGAPIDVLGHSLGGLLAVRAAARTADVRRLVLYEPAVDEEAQPDDLVRRMEGLLADDDRDATVRLMLHEVLDMPEDEIAQVTALPSWPTRLEAAHTLPRELSVPLRWDLGEASRVQVPTLLLVGGDSVPEMQAATRMLDAALPDSRVVVLEGQQHVADQLVPELFASRVLEFLLAEG